MGDSTETEEMAGCLDEAGERQCIRHVLDDNSWALDKEIVRKLPGAVVRSVELKNEMGHSGFDKKYFIS